MGQRILAVVSVVVIAMAALVAAHGGSAWSQELKPAMPAEAGKYLDLNTTELVAGSKPVARSLARLSYEAPGRVKEVYAFHQKQLRGAEWEELPGSVVEEAYGSGMFRRAGFLVSLSVSGGAEAGQARVSVIQHGNVDPGKLPVPEGAKALYQMPASAMHVIEGSPARTAEAVAGLLGAQGWEPYGSAGDVRFFKKGGVRVSALVGPAPAQGGKTMIQYSCELMSADLPAPADALAVQYSDAPTQVSVDMKGSVEDVAVYYRKALGELGWKETTENPVKEKFDFFWIFRNGAGEMVEMKIRDLKGKTRTLARYRTAAEVKEMLEKEPGK